MRLTSKNRLALSLTLWRPFIAAVVAVGINFVKADDFGTRTFHATLVALLIAGLCTSAYKLGSRRATP